MQINPLWDLYQNVVFELEQPLGEQLDFAIVTAFNPRGLNLTLGHNQTLDRALLADIEKLGVPYRRLFGCAPDKSHIEASWAIATDKETACKLASKYQQNAIYWVESNFLYLTPCLLEGYAEMCLGKYPDFVTYVELSSLSSSKVLSS
ncbi:DUF3293 domain-containing protein [Catenovulum sediminis]|uniref:DUF3293 domain-containing protein n=1 Tax=Catenovulum sediminis TaxID=1740262 RepID=A0ABV1RMZ3_9ALTE|nr:DUF3293 domain-containing protein [Catenovulum sediminis]